MRQKLIGKKHNYGGAKNAAIIYHTGYANEEKTEKKLVKYHRMILDDIKSRQGEKIIHFFLAREAYNHARTLVKKDGRLTKRVYGTYPTINEGERKIQLRRRNLLEGCRRRTAPR